MKIALFIVALAALASAAPKRQNRLSPRIVGGTLATPHSFPYQAFLEFWDNRYGWYCSGSLISQNYVLTSGTCSTTALEVQITLGAHNIFVTEPTQVNLFSKKILIQDDYEVGNYINDLAIIKLPKTVNLTDAIQLVALPKRADVGKNLVGAVGKVAGWGPEDGFDDYMFDLLRYATVEVLSNRNEDCQYFAIDLRSNMLCVSGEYGGDDVGPCNGDDGGPLVVDGVQISVISFGIAYWLEGYPSAHTRTDSFLDWIEANTDLVLE